MRIFMDQGIMNNTMYKTRTITLIKQIPYGTYITADRDRVSPREILGAV